MIFIKKLVVFLTCLCCFSANLCTFKTYATSDTTKVTTVTTVTKFTTVTTSSNSIVTVGTSSNYSLSDTLTNNIATFSNHFKSDNVDTKLIYKVVRNIVINVIRDGNFSFDVVVQSIVSALAEQGVTITDAIIDFVKDFVINNLSDYIKSDYDLSVNDDNNNDVGTNDIYNELIFISIFVMAIFLFGGARL